MWRGKFHGSPVITLELDMVRPMYRNKLLAILSLAAFGAQTILLPPVMAVTAVKTPVRRAQPTGAKSTGAEPIGDKWAVVIGVSRFADARIPELKYASKDAKDFYDYLVDQNGGKFQPDHVKLLVNGDATKINIMDMIGDSFLPHAASPNDLVVIYLSTHGSPAGADVRGVNYVIAHDTRPNKLFATGLEMRQLLRIIKERVHTNRVLLVLDTCYSGAGALGHKGLTRTNVDSASLAQGIGSLVISSSSPEQRSWESDGLKNSYFTRYLIDTLKEGGTTPIETAFGSMKQKVQNTVLREKGEMQTPVLAGSFSGPRLVLGVPPKERRPAPITIPFSDSDSNVVASASEAKGDDFTSYGQRMRTAQELIDQGKFFDAMHELDRAIKDNPSSVEAQLVLSDVMDAQAKWMQSLEAAKCAVRNDENSAQAREKLSRAYVRLQNSDEALRQAQMAATLDPQSSMAHFYMGVINEKFGNRVDQAEQFYRKAIEINGANAPALVALANLLRKEGRNADEVETLIKHAIEADSDDPDAHLAYARLLYERKGQFKEAEKLLREAINVSPNDPMLHAELGVVLSNKEDTYTEAEAEFRKAIELNKNGGVGYPRFVFAHFLADKRQRYDQAEEEYAAAIKADGSLDQARIEYGNLLVRRKKYDDADLQYNKALVANPKNSLAHLGLGRIQYELFKDYKAAEAQLQKATILDPKLSAAYDLLGDVYYYGLHRYTDAKKAYETAIQVDGKNASAHYHLAMLMLDRVKENNPQTILDALTKATASDAAESRYQTKLGYVMQTYFKQFKPAEEAYRKAIALNVADSEAHMNLGLLLITKFGQRKEGERELRTAFEQNPKDVEIKSAFERYVH